jgi:5-methylcytosine-specific restriction endonuclease McrA
MNRKALVLNQDYSPISVCTVERAFLLTWMRKTEMLRHFPQEIRAVSRSYPMPAVVRLNRYVHVPYKGVNLTRQNIFKRDGNVCQYCGTPRDLTLDHVLPKARGGTSTWTNLVTACKRCNAKKGDSLPDEAGMKLPLPPFKPSYVVFLRDYSGYLCEEWQPFLQTSKVGQLKYNAQ